MRDPVRDYWIQLCRCNPKLVESNRMTITIDSFRLAVQRAYSQGRSDAESELSVSSPLEALFGAFGKTRNKDQL